MSQEDAPIRRLKWGTASLIARAPVTPIVLPIVHSGFEQVIYSTKDSSPLSGLVFRSIPRYKMLVNC